MSMEWYARAGARSERPERVRLEPAVVESVLEAPSASAVEASAREMAMEVEWREEKMRVMSSLITPLVALAAALSPAEAMVTVPATAVIARVCLRTSRAGMEPELGRE